MLRVLAIAIAIVCLVILEATDEVKGPKVTEKVTILDTAVTCWIIS